MSSPPPSLPPMQQEAPTARDGSSSNPPVFAQRLQLQTKSRRSRRPRHKCHSSCSSTSSSSSFSSSSDVSLPLASAPRTVEFLWSGCAAPGFTLKRKRSGAIFVSTVTHETHVATTLKVGSEFKLVGGFPVNRLSLHDVKQVMLLAPKPVSLVFVNTDEVKNMNINTDMDVNINGDVPVNQFSEGRRRQSSTTLSSGSLRRSVSLDSTTAKDASKRDRCSKDRHVSKLQMALHRVNQLLNRPVRQAGLHVAVGKSIVV